MKSQKSTYIPGMCNIGPAEIKLRRQAGIAGLVLAVVLWVAFMLLDTPAAWRLVIFLPATLGAIGLLQAQLHFCVNFAMRGLFNVSEALQREESVDQKEYRQKDQRKAIEIISLSVAIGVAVAALAYFIG